MPQRMPLERVMQIAEFRAGLRQFLRESEEVSRRWGLTPQRYLLLLQVKGAPDGDERLSFTALAERLKVSPNTVTELVTRAEQAGLVRRERSGGDQRVVFVRLTEEGERRLHGVLEESDEARRELIRSFEALQKTFKTAWQQ
jgi:DNA-binding MarR family transcriptional regulator